MSKFYVFLILTFTFAFTFSSQAKVYTGITFTPEEKALHASKVEKLTAVAGQCLRDYYFNQHLNFHKKYGVSKFYGNRKYTKGEKVKVVNGRKLIPIRPVLRKLGLDPNLEKQMEHMSCVDFSRKCLRQGFESVGLADQWKKIDAFIPQKIGNRLQHALQSLGWKILYFNPKPSMNAIWDANDKEVAPKNPLNVWGHNEDRYNSVIRRGTYLYNKVDDARSLVNFDQVMPRFLEDIDFAVGTANGGYHVFLVTRGSVIEAHSTRQLTSIDNLEYSKEFNPLKNGGGPRWTRKEKYRTGIMVVPPSY